MLRRKPTRLTLSDVDQEEFQEMSEKHAAQVRVLSSRAIHSFNTFYCHGCV